MTASIARAVPEAARVLAAHGARRVAVAACLGDDVWTHGESDDIYELGSVTKVFVGSLLADFAERGLVSVDDTVVQHLPFAAAELGVTLAELATHTSGLPRLPDNFREFMPDRRDPFAAYGEEALVAALRRARPVRAAGRHVYSNFGFAVLGYVLACRGGASLGRLIQERVCAPLSLRDTSFHLDAERAARLVTGHTWRGKAVPHWSYGVFDAAGALKSTARDSLQFLRAQTRAESPLARAFLRARTQTWRGRSFSLGLGWFLSQLDGLVEVWHTGATGGFASYAGFVPDRDAGVVVLVDHGLSLWGAFVDNPVERSARRLLRVLAAEAGARSG